VDNRLKCDGNADCLDGSDEFDCGKCVKKSVFLKVTLFIVVIFLSDSV